MKKIAAAGVSLVLLSAGAYAQSSVTLYGIVDLGVDYANNVANATNGSAVPGSGGRLFQMQSGVPLGSRWGLLGSEDLGGGLRAVFRLESGFDAATGSSGGLAFSRNAYVGIASERFGTLTFGRQWDANVDLLEPFTLNGQYGGWYFAHPNDMDNLDNGFSVPNAIKYVSPTIAGVTVEGHYSPGGRAGQFSTDSTFSAAVAYRGGAFSAGVGYLQVNDPATAVAGYASGGGYANAVYGDALAAARSQRVIAAGAAYAVGAFKVSADFSNTVFRPAAGGGNLSFQNYEVSGTWQATGALLFGAGFTFTVGHDDAAGKSPRYQQLNLIAQYALSKRTSVYAMVAGQNASGDAPVAQIAGFNPSNTTRQVVGRAGITHQF
ncbi:porin [Burkholderia pseudomultivorans]|uniref:Porin n=1 Tax=Burkholderia pseudomultivorans TaxID=1207504 RepID=A0A132EC76_9BURK|nr:porin [Burkholderia pseudomultivorans]KWF24769.1 porin [Burkholderia pseudomultivorans]MDR8729948.1 Outer membrane porin protein [Burkholderia pseudomultivorans]MDR8735790.1 Outer membrane porin protein [Burkholderia pseudomultivorans]MDR8744396.1 Outer membrane porin protein [Burkholderia pseudomultivorans]MDR8756154.1 Outer membrane porin protein [Burkholderia pseudomultivorans]